MHGRDFLTLADLTPEELQRLLDRASLIKAAQARRQDHRLLNGYSLAMLFEKASLRTRTTFVLGMSQLGGTAIDLMSEHTQLGVRESIPDIANNLERWVDALMARVYDHSVLDVLAECANIPIINGLSDHAHPCQTLADLLTIREQFGELAGRQLTYVGDGFNVCNSLIYGAALTGMHIRVATPSGYEPDNGVVAGAQDIAREHGGSIHLSNAPNEATRNAEIVYTDAWISMGLEHEATQRRQIFEPFRVSTTMMGHAKPDAIFMHCLPAHRGDEVDNAVIDSAQSAVFVQAENRLHTQKALLVLLLRGDAAFDELPT